MQIIVKDRSYRTPYPDRIHIPLHEAICMLVGSFQ